MVEEKLDVLGSIKNASLSRMRTVKQVKIPGPQASRYNASFDQGKKKFKDGQRESVTDKICKRRYTLLYVTALGNVSLTIPDTTPARVLQALPPPTNTTSSNKLVLNLIVSSEYFTS